MADTIRLMIQLKSGPSLGTSAYGAVRTAPATFLDRLTGIRIDNTYSPVPILPKTPPDIRAATGMKRFEMAFPGSGDMSHIVRAEVENEGSMERLLDSVADARSPVIGAFADPRIEPVAVCPLGPVGTDRNIEELLAA